MALVLADRVLETTTTAGTGTVTLAGATTGYQSFAAIGNGNTTYYCIADTTATNWEVGIGTYTSSGTTLSRDTVLASSNAGNLVSFGSGSKNVFVVIPSAKATYEDANGNVAINNTFNGYTSFTSSGGTTTLTATSTMWQKVGGTNTHTVKLPDATTLPQGAQYVVDNDSSGDVQVVDAGNTLIDTLVSGALGIYFVELNSSAAGLWGKYGWLPATINWGNTTVDFGGTQVTNADIVCYYGRSITSSMGWFMT